MVITISRLYGAGGRSVAKSLSGKLNIPWYDNDFVKKIAAESGYSEEEIIEEGEEISKTQRRLDAVLNSANSYVSSHDEIFKAQRKALISIAKETCIIVGRCGNVILKEEKIPAFNVFLYASKEERIRRMMTQQGLSEAQAAKEQKKHDTFRQNYYDKYTGHRMDDVNDYNLCIDTELMGYDDVAEIIIDFMKKKGWV